MPVLFNRWRDPVCDFGGVPLDHILAGASLYCEEEDFVAVDRPGLENGNPQKHFGEYIGAVVGTHAADERILSWDLCNEPLMGRYVTDPDSPIRNAELRWLGWCREMCKASGAEQPITIGIYPNFTAAEITEPLMDLISFHPYYAPSASTSPLFSDDLWASLMTKEAFENYLDEVVELAARTGKEVLASETVWASELDLDRVPLIRYTLGELTKRRIGFVAFILHHSPAGDAHSSAYGPVTVEGRFEFINADGSLRGFFGAPYRESKAMALTLDSRSFWLWFGRFAHYPNLWC